MSSTRSLRRPGVAMTTSTPRGDLGDLRVARGAAEDEHGRAAACRRRACAALRRSAPRVRGSARGSARGWSSASARSLSAAMPARIGRPKAAVLPEPVWAMPRMSRPCELRADGALLDGGGGVESGSGQRLGEVRGKSESGKSFGQNVFSCCPRRPANAAHGCPAPLGRAWMKQCDGSVAVALCRRNAGTPGASPLTALAGKKRSPSPMEAAAMPRRGRMSGIWRTMRQIASARRNMAAPRGGPRVNAPLAGQVLQALVELLGIAAQQVGFGQQA